MAEALTRFLDALKRFLRLYLAGLFWGPLLFLAPVGALDMIHHGWGKAFGNWPFVVMFLAPILPALLLFGRSAGMQKPEQLILSPETHSPAVANALSGVGAATAGAGAATLGCVGLLIVVAVVGFVVAGIAGLLWFGVKQLL